MADGGVVVVVYVCSALFYTILFFGTVCVFVCVCVSVCMCACLPVCLPACLYTRLPVYLSVWLSVCASVGLVKVSSPGVEPGLSQPQRDVLTTRRWGLVWLAGQGTLN